MPGLPVLRRNRLPVAEIGGMIPFFLISAFDGGGRTTVPALTNEFGRQSHYAAMAARRGFYHSIRPRISPT